MKSLLRLLFSLLIMLATLLMASCSPYGCHVTFGSSTCTSTGTGGLGGGGGGGGGGGSASAFVYAVDQTAATIDGYALSSSSFGSITGFTAPAIPPNTGGVGMVVAQKQFLYAGFGSSGQLFGWVIGANGSLTSITNSPYPATYLADNVGVGQSDMITNPAGTLLFISDTLAHQIYAYQIGTGGILTLVTGSPFALPSGFTPMNLATDGFGKYLYAINGTASNHTGSQIAAFVIGTGTSFGALTAVPNSPFTYPMWQVKGDPTGQFLIGTSGRSAFYPGVTDDDHLYMFTITTSGTNAGAITPLVPPTFPTTYSPFSIAAQSNTGGNLVYSLSFNDTATAFNNIEGFSISGTGTPSMLTNSPFSNVGNGSWAQFDESGTIMVVYASFLNQSTNTITTQLSPLAVAASGALTQPLSTLTINAPGFWVVTDGQ
jgi:hypothetical protein